MTAVAEVVAALDALAAETVAGESTRDDLLALDRARARLDAEVSRRLRAFDASSEWSVDGSKSPAAFLTRHTRCARGEAHTRVRVARHVAELPATAAAWAAGEITTGHVEAIVQARHGARANDAFDEFEPSLLTLARAGTPEDVTRTARQWRDALDADRNRDGSGVGNDQTARRRFDFSRSIDGMGFGSLALDPLGSEFVETALRAVYAEMHLADDPRTPTQQRADAFVEICRRYSESRSRRANLPTVLAIVDEPTLAGDAVGECRLASGARVSPDVARRLACDGTVQTLLRGADGVPLALGRTTRTFTPDQFRYFVVRDTHCRGPGCDVEPAHCEAHHLDQWQRDRGPTDVDNGALFCRGHCHHMLHEGGWTVRGRANGTLEFYDRSGRYLGFSAPASAVPPMLTGQGRKRARLDQCIRRRAHALRS